jgi:hypothetical protein
MRLIIMRIKPTIAILIAIIASIFAESAIADEGEKVVVAFPDKFMIRAGAYFVDGSRTQFSINSSNAGLGTTIDYKRDLGGEERETIPRIDAYYRFNDRHRIDFTTFSINRAGRRALDIEIKIGDEIYAASDTLNSEIKYTLYKVGYSYSFYRSPEVELSFSAGLNVTSYDFEFSNDTGGQAEAAGVTVPLPVFGLRMGYSITPKWSIQYVA